VLFEASISTPCVFFAAFPLSAIPTTSVCTTLLLDVMSIPAALAPVKLTMSRPLMVLPVELAPSTSPSPLASLLPSISTTGVPAKPVWVVASMTTGRVIGGNSPDAAASVMMNGLLAGESRT